MNERFPTLDAPEPVGEGFQADLEQWLDGSLTSRAMTATAVLASLHIASVLTTPVYGAGVSTTYMMTRPFVTWARICGIW